MGSGAIQTNNINVAWSLNKYGRKKKEVDICHVFIYWLILQKVGGKLAKRRIGKSFVAWMKWFGGILKHRFLWGGHVEIP